MVCWVTFLTAVLKSGDGRVQIKGRPMYCMAFPRQAEQPVARAVLKILVWLWVFP